MSENSPLPVRFVMPEVVATHFHLRLGDVVADFGAGKGYFIAVLSKLVGPEGRVYACEIQKNLVEAIADTVRTASLSNVESIWCDIEARQGTKIEDGTLDVAVLINTFFQMDDRQTALEEIKRTLRSGGKLFVIDWSESFGGLGPQPDQVISEEETKALCETQGLAFERNFDAGDHHYGLAFRKP